MAKGRHARGRLGRAALVPVAAAAALAAGYLYLVMPGDRAGDRIAPFERTYIAHRGLFDNGAGVPENSLAAFSRAIDAGYAIELDVQLTADGTVVVSHDRSQKRVAGVDRELGEMGDAEVAALRLFGTDEGVPTFQEALDLIGGRVPLLVEIKAGRGSDAPALAAATAEVLDGYDGIHAVQSFNPLALRWFKDNRPGTARGILAADFPNFHAPDAEEPVTGVPAFALSNMLANALARPNFISYEFTGYGQPTFALVRSLTSIDCLAWTIRSGDDLAAARAAGADGIIFDGFIPAG